jgi:hypothetical protein
MNRSSLVLPAVVALALSITGCSSPGNVVSPIRHSGTYTQIELLSRPAIKEVFEPYQDHQKTNAVEPYADTTIQNDIVATEDALRPPTATTDYGKALAGILYPDEYLVNLSGAAPASGTYFLSYEVSGGADFGGRAPNDDVVGLELGALFGKTLSSLGIIADDGEENNCLSAQNITEDPSKKTTATFPYLTAPH